MGNEQVTMHVTGFTHDEVRAGIPDLVAEFTARPWLLNPQVRWNTTNRCLWIQIERDYEDGDPDIQAMLDDVWDCVIATVSFSSERISFTIVGREAIRNEQREP